jgi:hypothetical protein
MRIGVKSQMVPLLTSVIETVGARSLDGIKAKKSEVEKVGYKQV